jgi:hypothetical protein
MPNLFARAAASLVGETPEPADADVQSLLGALGYVAGAGETGSGAETRHCADLLRAAARFLGFSSWRRPTRPDWSVLAPNSILESPTQCMPAGRRSAFRRGMPFRDVLAKASNIYRSCNIGMICCNHWNRASPHWRRKSCWASCGKGSLRAGASRSTSRTM